MKNEYKMKKNVENKNIGEFCMDIYKKKAKTY